MINGLLSTLEESFRTHSVQDRSFISREHETLLPRMKLREIFRYPVKGLLPEILSSVELTPGRGIPSDRRFAIAHGQSEFDFAEPKWTMRRNFLVVAHSPRLARLRGQFANDGRALKLEVTAEKTLLLDLESRQDRASLADVLAEYAGSSQGGPYSVVEVPGVNLTDSSSQTVSIFNERSLVELETRMGRPVDKQRFRGNFWIDGNDPWEEFEWVGRDIEIGDVVLRVTQRIARCTATNANPDTGRRDMSIPQVLHETYGHIDFGVLAEVRVGGTAAVNDKVRISESW